MSRFISTDYHGVIQNAYSFRFYVSLPVNGRIMTVRFSDLWDAAAYSDRMARRLKLSTPINFPTATERKAAAKAAQAD
jgi:hypothetical protein